MKSNSAKNSLRRFYCDDKLTRLHEKGDWELSEEGSFHKVFVKRCRFCKAVLNEDMKR